MEPVLYVDSIYGSASNNGSVTRPFDSISTALSSIPSKYSNYTIVLQNGSYGDVSLTKNINLKAAFNTTPTVGTITVTNAQCMIDGLYFSSMDKGIVIDNQYGAVSIQNCSFDNVVTPIEINGTNYVGIYKNSFKQYQYGIKINDAVEVVVTSNLFYDQGYRAIDIFTVDRLDLWRNTIYGANSFGTGLGSYDEDLRVIYKTINSSNLFYKRIPLPGFAALNVPVGYDVAFNSINGPAFLQGLIASSDVDYYVTGDGSLVSWNGCKLDGQFQLGDIVRVAYSEDNTRGGNEAVRAINVGDPNSTVDSNFIGKSDLSGGGDIGVGVFINTPIKVRYNNFYKVTTPVSGTPTEYIGNTGVNPQFVDPEIAFDFHLTGANGPEVNGGDPERWHYAYTGMGITIVNGSYTGMDGATRTNVTPFGRDIDRDGVNRLFNYEMINNSSFLATADNLQGNYIGDRGAYEYTGDVQYTGDYYVNENGYSEAYPGSEQYPYNTLDKAFLNSALANDIVVNTNKVDITGITGDSFGSRYGRYITKDMLLSSKDLIVGNQTFNDVAYFYPYDQYFEATGLTYVDPTGSDVSGNGTEINAYRTINRALEDLNNYIVVNPGIYPLFQAVAGKRLVGIPRTYYFPLDWKLYSKVSATDWTVDSGSPTFSRNRIIFDGLATLTSNFTFSGDIKYKSNLILTSGTFFIELYNDNAIVDKVSIELSKSGANLNISYKFTISGSSYTFNNTVNSYIFTDPIFLNIDINNGIMSCLTKSSDIFSITKTLPYTNVGNWRIILKSTTIPASLILKNINVNADSFSGVTSIVYDSTSMRWKMFGILGTQTVPGI